MQEGRSTKNLYFDTNLQIGRDKTQSVRVMVHSVQFPFQPPSPLTEISVDTILKNHNSGNFTVSACIKWLGEPVKLEHATKMVREAELTDPSGTINL